MNQNQFQAQDAAGNRCRVRVLDHAPKHNAAEVAGQPSHRVYVLEDGSAVKRIDNDTFQVLSTGAYITMLRE